MTEWLPSHDKILLDGKFLLMDEQKKWFLEMEPIPGEYAIEIVENDKKRFRKYINWINKAAPGLEKIAFKFEKSSTVGEMPSNSITCYRDIIHKRKGQFKWQTSLLSYFKKCHNHRNLHQPPIWSVSSHQNQGSIFHQ